MAIDEPKYNLGITLPDTKQDSITNFSLDTAFQTDYMQRRSEEEKARYDAMKRAEKQKIAIDKLMSDAFMWKLKRFYSEHDENAVNMSKQELVHKFYQDRIWSEWNSVGIGLDVKNVLSKDTQYKGDWAEITQLYADLPYFGRGGIPFWRWAKDFVPALVVDPINLYTLGTGKVVAATAAKTATTVTRTAFIKQAQKKAALSIGLKEAAAGMVIGGTADHLRQRAEIDANLMTDYNVSRSLIAILGSGVAQGTVGAGMSYWGSKGIAGKFYDKGDGFLGDTARDFGSAANKQQKSYSGKTGKVIEFEPIDVGTKVKAPDRGNIGTVITIVDDVAKVLFVSKDGAQKTKMFKVSELASVSRKKKVIEVEDITVLPSELKGAKPRYNYGNRSVELEFDNDIAKALYIVGGKGESTSHKAYMAFLENAGVKNISKKAQVIRDSIKSQAKGGAHTAKVSANIPKQKIKIKVPDEDIVNVKPKPDESKTIIKKADEIDRKTPFINLSKIDDKGLRNEVANIISRLEKEGKLRTTERKGLLQTIKKEGIELWKNGKKFADELLLANRVAPHLSKVIFAGRHNILAMAHKIRQLRLLADEAVTESERKLIREKLLTAVKQKAILVNQHLKNVEGVSDALNQQRLMSELSDADRLRIETDNAINEGLPDIIANIEKLPLNKQLNALKVLAEVTGGTNDHAMRKMINGVNRKRKNKKVSFFDAWNEYATANLLGDLTTHEVNILSAAIRFQMGWAEDYFSGIISVGKGDFRTGWNQIQMANDLLLAQFRVFNVAFKKAKLAWKTKQNIGDILEHRLDGTKLHSMETWLKSMKDTDVAWKNVVGHAGTPLSKFVYTTLRLLQAGDAFTKNIFQRAARVAVVNQRMRAFYPELWAKRTKFNKLRAVRHEENIRDVKQNIRWETAKDAPNTKLLTKLNTKLSKLEKENIELTSFEEKWKELYFQYEDEFGNFRQTRTFNELEIKTLDDLTKSVVNDPTYRARVASFTQNLKNEALDPNQFYPNQQQSKHNLGNFVLNVANKAPLLRVLTGLHFLKTPINLFKDGWKMTPLINKLNMEFRAMTTAADPIVRSKANGIKALGATTYGVATYMAMNGKMTGVNEKDRKKRLAFVLTDDDGNKRYVSMMRLFPLTIPFMVTAIIHEKVEEFGDMWSDPKHSVEQTMLTDLFQHIASTAFVVWTSVFSSQLMTQDFFEMMGLLMQTDATEEEANETLNKLENYMGKTGSKHIPIATFWRWTNKVIAEGEAQLMTWTDHFKQSSPYAFLKWANEQMGNKYSILNYGNSLSRKRDPLGNFYPKPKGLVLGHIQDTFPTVVHWSMKMIDSKGNKIILSDRAKQIIQTSKIQWERPRYTFDVGLSKRLNMKEIKFVQMKEFYTKSSGKGLYLHYPIGDNKKTLTLFEGATMYEVMSEVKSHIRLIDGMTLNERFQYELENPNSNFNTYYARNRMIAGKYEGDTYLLSVIREYESAARDYVMRYAYIEIDGNVMTGLEIKKYSNKLDIKLHEPIPENLRMIIN